MASKMKVHIVTLGKVYTSCHTKYNKNPNVCVCAVLDIMIPDPLEHCNPQGFPLLRDGS